MALFTDLPAELRQHIIRLIPGGVPAEVRLDHHQWPDPVNQLLVTCKLLRADTIQVMSTWSFDCLISRSAFIDHLPRLIRAIRALGLDNKVQKIRLLVWSLMEIQHIRDPSSTWRQHGNLERIATKWTERLERIPTGDIKLVVVDATPLPQRIIEKRPQLVDANLRLFFTSMFVSSQKTKVSDIILQAKKHFNPAASKEEGERIEVDGEHPDPGSWTRIVLGGRFGENSRSTIEAIMEESGIPSERDPSDACAFVGSFCDKDMPAHLSLHLLVRKCGIQLDTGGREGLFSLDVSGVKLLEDAHTNEVEPGRDFSALGPLALGRASTSAFYINALEDGEAARAAVIKVLTFAADCRQCPGAVRHLNFLPATPTRRRLVHELCHDMGLAHSTVDGQYGKFVRVSSSSGSEADHVLEQPMETLSISHPRDT